MAETREKERKRAEKRRGPAGRWSRFWGLLAIGAALFLFFRLTAQDPDLRIGFASLFTALSLHEGGHLLAMLLCGGLSGPSGPHGKRIRVFPWGIELYMARGYRSYGEQVLVSLGGVGANFFTAAILLGPLAGLSCGEGMLPLFFGDLARCSLLLGFLHLLPVEGLDGGSALEGTLLSRTGLSPERVGKLMLFFSILLLIPLWLLSLCVLIASGGNPSFFALCVSLFLELYRKQGA